MVSFYSNFVSNGAVRIEVDGGTSHRTYDCEFVKGLAAIASLLAKSISSLPKEERPEDLSLTCGLVALPEGGFAITSGTEKANFKVHFSLAKSKEGGIGIFPESAFGVPGSS